MNRANEVLLLVLVSGCASAPVTRPQEPLVATPTRVSVVRQLPAELDVDPTKLTPPPLEFELKAPQVVTLPNGLTLYLLEDHTAPLVLLRALLPVGAVDEPAVKLGLTSLLASLLTTGGAGPRTPDALEELLAFHAADLGAGAGDEYTTVQLSLRAADLTTLFPVFADVVQRPRFDEKRFEVAKGRLLEGLRRREDRPESVASRALSKALYGPTSLLGREALESTVNAVTVADVKSLHAATWGATSTRLIVTGDFDTAQVRKLVEQHFGTWKGGTAPHRRWEPPLALQRRVILVPRKVAQAKVRIGTFGYARNSAKEYPLRLANTVLGTFGVGRLYKEIRDEKGLAYSAFSSIGPGPTTGQFTAGFDTKPAQVAEALEAATRILSTIGNTAPLTDAELRTAKDVALNTFAFRFDSAAKVAFERAQFELLGYPRDYLAKWRAQISDVTAAQSSEAAKQLDEGLQIIVVGPPELIGDLSRFGPVSTITDVEQFR